MGQKLLGIFSLAAVCAACGSSNGEDVASEDAALEAQWGEYDEDAIPLADRDFDDAAALSDIDADRIYPAEQADIEVTMPDAPAPEQFERPAYCKPGTSLDLLVYYEVFGNGLWEQLGKHTSGCSQYWVAIPKVAASAGNSDTNLFPRKLNVRNIHNYGNAFRATSEVHWGSTRDENGDKHPGWKNVEVVKTGKATYETREIPRAKYFRVNWYLKGVLFRQRMAKAGYLTQTGDTWHINELESSWARSPAYLKVVRDLTRGLADGDPEYDAFTDPDPAIAAKTADEKTAINVSAHKSGVRGVVYISAIGRRLDGETSDEPWMNAIKQTLRKRKFWADMANYAEFWGQERYLAYPAYCKAGTSLDGQTAMMEAFQQALPNIARQMPRYKGGDRAGQSTVGTALFYLTHRHTTVINSAWTDTSISAQKMGDFVAGQIYAARSFANEHDDVGGDRLGIYWHPRDGADVATDPGNLSLAERVAVSVNGAYDGRDGSASGACGARGVAGCKCGD
jgi:hypothetical protein